MRYLNHKASMEYYLPNICEKLYLDILLITIIKIVIVGIIIDNDLIALIVGVIYTIISIYNLCGYINKKTINLHPEIKLKLPWGYYIVLLISVIIIEVSLVFAIILGAQSNIDKDTIMCLEIIIWLITMIIFGITNSISQYILQKKIDKYKDDDTYISIAPTELPISIINNNSKKEVDLHKELIYIDKKGTIILYETNNYMVNYARILYSVNFDKNTSIIIDNDAHNIINLENYKSYI